MGFRKVVSSQKTMGHETRKGGVQEEISSSKDIKGVKDKIAK